MEKLKPKQLKDSHYKKRERVSQETGKNGTPEKRAKSARVRS